MVFSLLGKVSVMSCLPCIAGVNNFMHNCSEKLDKENSGKLDTDNCLCCGEIQIFTFASAQTSGADLCSHAGSDG